MKTKKGIRNIVDIANGLLIDARELYEGFDNENTDFEVENYRFIKENTAEEIITETLESDPYILGCFNDWFISDECGIDLDVVVALQETDNYEALGKLMISNGIGDLVSEYVRLDGYGHAFGSYDGNYEEVIIDSELYIYFRTN